MAIRIQYQNNVTGAAFDITTLVSGAKWSTKRSGSPASLELTAIVNDEIQWSHGGIVTLLDDKTGLFYGYVVKISQNEKEQVQITAYDQTWYLKKNKDTYVFKGKRADQVLKQIAEDFKLKTGSLANTGYSIPSMIEDGQTLFDIVLKAIDYTLINTGKMFVLWDNFGKLTLTDVETAKLDLFVGDGSLATGFTYESEIDSEAYNKIKLVKDNKKTGKRDVYIFQDSKNMTLWGILQDYEVVDEDMNEAQIKKRGGQMLELYNRPKRSFSVSAIADLSVRAGRVGGFCDETEAMKQAIYKILQTERFEYLIYSWNYGIELNAVVGKSFQVFASEIKRVIREALLADSRITDVTDFEVAQIDKRTASVKFTAETIFGEIPIESEVNVNV